MFVMQMGGFFQNVADITIAYKIYGARVDFLKQYEIAACQRAVRMV